MCILSLPFFFRNHLFYEFKEKREHTQRDINDTRRPRLFGRERKTKSCCCWPRVWKMLSQKKTYIASGIDNPISFLWRKKYITIPARSVIIYSPSQKITFLKCFFSEKGCQPDAYIFVVFFSACPILLIFLGEKTNDNRNLVEIISKNRIRKVEMY